jgi:hypothetical protein
LLKGTPGVKKVEPEYKRKTAVYKRPSLVGDFGPESSKSATTSAKKAPPPKGKTPVSAKATCQVDNTDPSSSEVTPWGIVMTQATDPLLRNIGVASSILYCVVDSGGCLVPGSSWQRG